IERLQNMPRGTASLPEKPFAGGLQHRIWDLHEPLPEKIATGLPSHAPQMKVVTEEPSGRNLGSAVRDRQFLYRPLRACLCTSATTALYWFMTAVTSAITCAVSGFSGLSASSI